MTGQPFEQTLGLSKLLGRLHLFREFVVRRSSIGVLSERWGIFDAQPNTEKQKQPKKPGAGTLTQRHARVFKKPKAKSRGWEKSPGFLRDLAVDRSNLILRLLGKLLASLQPFAMASRGAIGWT